MLEARELSTVTPITSGRARLDDICRRAIARANTASKRLVAYVPPPDLDGVGCWDAASLTFALSLLVEEALLSTTDRAHVEVRWRTDGEHAVIRVRFPRPLDSGVRLVTFSDADARPREDRRRLVGAREVILAQGGTLARVRTRRATTYVVTLPRCERRRARGSCPTCSPVRSVKRAGARDGLGAASTADAIVREALRARRVARPVRDPVQLWRQRRLANHAAMTVMLSALLVVMGVVAVATAIQHPGSAAIRAAAGVPLAAAAGVMLWARAVRSELVREGEEETA
ncbi:MAG TPA: hypothetical protein VFK85_06675 [Anaeromyxobacteraceae bacterium]|nr:hypothetical protein [Anaeromyxobacteraceae bacterium]